MNIAFKQRPIEGKANIELVKVLSKLLKVPRSQVEIHSGHKSKLKTIWVTGEPGEIEQVVKTLQALEDEG